MPGTLRLHRDGQPPLELQGERAMVGRDKGCDVQIDDPSVSRRHVAFERRGGDWLVVDQGSVNGSFLDGKRVGEAPLRDGQRLRLGSVELRVEIEPDALETVMIAASAPDEDATVMMKTPEEAPPVTSVEIRVPVLAPPVPAPPASPPPARPPVVAARPPVAPAPPAPPPVLAAPPPVLAARPPVLAARPPVLAARPPVAPAPPAPPPVVAADPWALLGLRPGAAADEVSARYRERAQELQAKLASARTPGLHGTYEKNLAALERAFREIGPPAGGDDLLHDLPSAQPTVDADTFEKSEGRAPAALEPPPPSEAAPAKGRAALLPPATTVLAFAATGMLALCAFFALSSSKLQEEIRKEEEAPELVAARQAAAKYQGAEELLKGGALRNGKLRLCNRSGRPLEIDWLAAVYLQKEELPASADAALASLASGFKVVTYNSSFCPRDFRLTLAPGAEQAVAFGSEDARCRFEGEAIFFALSLQRPAGPQGSPAPEAAERNPDEPGATYWLSGLPGGRDDCVSVGAGW